MPYKKHSSECPFKTGSGTIRTFERSRNKDCEECQTVLQIWQNNRDRYRAATHSSELSSKTGLVSVRHPRFSGDDYIIAFDHLAEDEKQLQEGIRIRLAQYVLYRSSVQSHIVTSDSQPIMRDHQFTSVGKLLRIVQSWLSTCVSKHRHCTVPEPNFQPQRLIDVGDHQSHPFLTERPICGRPYAALSYCWGLVRCSSVTNRQNLQQHFQKIDFSSLSKSVRDAIVVCRFLGIPYLWVDALCIIQDDINDQDWYDQSLHMGSIYLNAHLVISVDAAEHCGKGFLPPEETYSWEPIPTHETDRTGLVRLVRETHIDEDKRALCGTSSLQTQPLSTRGWTMQECILPNRVLHFAEKELIWECNTCRNCECGHPEQHALWKDHNYSLINFSHMKPEDEEDSIHIDEFLQKKNHDSICWVWERLMELYSLRFLTVHGDKLAAVSGLARLFQKRLQADPTDYLAGIWDINLPTGLLWYVTGTPVSSRPKTWRAPTWSWASLDGGIKFFHERYQFHFSSSIHVIERHCKPRSVDPFSKIETAYMKLWGQLVAVNLNVVAKTSTTHNSQFNGLNGKPWRAFEDQVATVRRTDGKSRSYEVLLDLQINAGEYCFDMYCLKLGYHENDMRPGKRTWWLVLRRTADSSNDRSFERMGIGVFDSASRDADLFPKGAEKREAEIVLV